MTFLASHYSDEYFRAWAQETEAELARLASGYEPPPPTATERDRICRDAFKAIARDIPDPYEFAMVLEPILAEAVAAAHRAQDPANSGSLRVSLAATSYCFAMGLSDRDGYLGAFGMAVRRELMADER